MVHSHGYCAHDTKSEMVPYTFERREVGENDVQIDIIFCGMCHSDLHQIRDEWGGSIFPMVPGHEIVGEVSKVGGAVKKFKVGDRVGVGCMVDSCLSCDYCTQHKEEQNCQGSGPVWTYNARDKLGNPTYGGYATNIVVKQEFVVSISPKVDLAATAPLLCAGITTYSPLRTWGVKKGDRVGVVGLGGLGHMGVKFAVAFGAQVTVFSHSAAKAEDAKRLGAANVVITKDPDALKPLKGQFDFILDTVSAPHDLAGYLNCLRVDGSLVLVGLPEKPPVLPCSALMGRKRLSFSNIGGIKETQEMLDFCAEHNIVADIEVVPFERVNEALERMLKSDVRYRFVLDNSTIKK